MTQLRAKARASGVYFRVVKNTLVRRAVADTPFATLADKMVGPLAYGIGADPVAVAKVLNDFAKGNEKFVIAGGAMPGQVMSPKEIAALAALPSRDELLAKLIGTMQAPIAKFVRTMNEVPGKFVRTLAAVRDAKPADLTYRPRIPISTRYVRSTHMSAVQTEILDKISSMTVLELSELIKAMEEKFGVSAAAAVAVAGPAAGARAGRRRRRADRVHRDAHVVRREQGQRHQGGARADGPGPEGSQGPRRRRAEAGQGRRHQGRRRSRQEEAGRSRREGRNQVNSQASVLTAATRRSRRVRRSRSRNVSAESPHEVASEAEDERL